MADFEHARALLRMAHRDFSALTGMLDNALFADEIFGFHVQQAVEKTVLIRLSPKSTTGSLLVGWAKRSVPNERKYHF